MCLSARHTTASEPIDSTRARWTLFVLLAGGMAMMGWMVTARYASWHSFVFDLGSYDQKVWLIAQQSSLSGMWEQTYKDGMAVSPCGINWYWGICHFQPWLLIPGFIYKVWDSPLLLLWLQVLLVVSGLIPVFLLARNSFDSPTAGVLAAVVYLGYPAVQYNGVFDFRPDHVAIPAMLWAYYFAGRGRYIASLAMMGLGSLAKETLILSGAFFGAYLAVRYKQRLMGALTFIFGIGAFYLVMFHLLRFGQISEGQFMIDRFFPSLSHFVSGTVALSPIGVIRELVQTRNLLYLEALLVPLAFLPLLSLPELIPAIPSLAMSLLSMNPGYASIDSQYSAALVAPAFAAMFVAIARFRRSRRESVAPVPLLAGTAVLSLFVSFGLGPTPLSRNFWNPEWGGRWHLAQYRPDRQQILDRAADFIPANPKVIVVSQNDINSPRLAHRYNFFAFPNALERADYVILDKLREPYVYWMWNPQQYQAIVGDLLSDPARRVIFNQRGVLVFERGVHSSVKERPQQSHEAEGH